MAALTVGMLFMTNARFYFNNIPFRVKLLLIALAGLNMVIFHLTSGRTVASWDKGRPVPRTAKITAALSLSLWIAVIFAGRVIGFTTTGAQAKEAAPPPAQNFDDFLTGGTPGSAPPTPEK